MIVKTRDSYKAYRIAPTDSNKMIMLFDPLTDGTSFVSIIEVFDVGGRTPPNMHEVAQEMFYVLSGTGRAHCGGEAVDMGPGDCMMVPPGGWHEVENTGPNKLYCLTVMTPNEGFAELILAGAADRIDDEDWAVIGGSSLTAC